MANVVSSGGRLALTVVYIVLLFSALAAAFLFW
jgi:hypothetical protein